MLELLAAELDVGVHVIPQLDARRSSNPQLDVHENPHPERLRGSTHRVPCPSSEALIARRRFEVVDIIEILQHWHAGRPKAVVATSLGVDRATVSKHVTPAVAAGMEPGGPPLSR
jgi:hypothetical protein